MAKFDLAELEGPSEEEIHHLNWRRENSGGRKKNVAKPERQEDKKNSPDKRREQKTAEPQLHKDSFWVHFVLPVWREPFFLPSLRSSAGPS